MKKKRGKTIQINLSNRLLYTLITIGILLIAGIGVYAWANENGVGHSITELEPCTTEGEILQINSTGDWECATISAGGEDTRCDTSGTCSQVCIGTACKGSWPSSGSLSCTTRELTTKQTSCDMICSKQGEVCTGINSGGAANSCGFVTQSFSYYIYCRCCKIV